MKRFLKRVYRLIVPKYEQKIVCCYNMNEWLKCYEHMSAAGWEIKQMQPAPTLERANSLVRIYVLLERRVKE